jgi:hypothetical protein
MIIDDDDLPAFSWKDWRKLTKILNKDSRSPGAQDPRNANQECWPLEHGVERDWIHNGAASWALRVSTARCEPGAKEEALYVT